MSLGALSMTSPKELLEISPTNSQSSSSIVIEFAEYVENAQNSRAEQKAARSDQHNISRPRLRSSDEDYVQHLFTFPKRLLGLTASTLSSMLTLCSPRSVIASLGQALRKDSLGSPRPATTRKTSWITIFLMIVSVCNNSTITVEAFAQLGFALGISLCSFLAATSFYASWLLWKLFMELDSFRYPVKTYGHLADRIYGKRAAWLVISVQSIDIMLVVGFNIQSATQWLTLGSSSSNISTLCFSTACLVTSAITICSAQIRPLYFLKWIALLSFVASVLQFATILGTSDDLTTSVEVLNTISHPASSSDSQPFPASKFPLGPVQHSFGYPRSLPGLTASVPLWVHAVNTMSETYWGNTVFTEFMAEMLDVADFRRALRYAWIWLAVQRLIPALSLYTRQGQYSAYSPFVNVFQGAASSKSVLVFCEVLQAIVWIVRITVQVNIALKVIFRSTLGLLFPKTVWTGRKVAITWAAAVPMYVMFCYLLLVCIPYFVSVTGVYFSVGWGFTAYGLPPILYIGHSLKQYNMIPGSQTSDRGARRGAMTMQPLNPWIAYPKRQKVLILSSILMIAVAITISGFMAWECAGDMILLRFEPYRKAAIMTCKNLAV